MAAKTIWGEVYEGAAAVLMARIVGASGAPLTQADFGSIKYEAWKIPVPLEHDLRNAEDRYVEVSTPAKVVNEVTLTVANVVFDALQTDGRWTKDTTGYNFAYELPANTWAAIALADYPKSVWYEIAVRFTPAVGQAFACTFKVSVKSILFGKS